MPLRHAALRYDDAIPFSSDAAIFADVLRCFYAFAAILLRDYYYAMMPPYVKSYFADY